MPAALAIFVCCRVIHCLKRTQETEFSLEQVLLPWTFVDALKAAQVMLDSGQLDAYGPEHKFVCCFLAVLSTLYL